MFGVLWAYYSREVRREWAGEVDEWRRAGLRRLYDYPLALAGNAAVFAGAWQVLGQVVELALVVTTWGDASRQALAGGIAWLAVGTPYWLSYWPVMQAEARLADDAGDHARRSVLRKSYLYLAVFLTVVGLMSSAGVLFYRLINALLGNPDLNLGLDFWQQVRSIALLAVWLVYHLVPARRRPSGAALPGRTPGRFPGAGAAVRRRSLLFSAGRGPSAPGAWAAGDLPDLASHTAARPGCRPRPGLAGVPGAWPTRGVACLAGGSTGRRVVVPLPIEVGYGPGSLPALPRAGPRHRPAAAPAG